MLSSTINIPSQELTLKVQQFLRLLKESLKGLPKARGLSQQPECAEGLCGAWTGCVITEPACGKGAVEG